MGVTAEQDRVGSVVDALRRNGGDLSRDEARQLLALSKSHFSRLFHAAYGNDFRHERLRIRLELAETLLTTTRTTIAEIAHAIGYQQRGKFDRAFKRTYGVTPAQFRRKFSSTAPQGIDANHTL
jgi:transcriptional regulator GlxA family with amidase domain